MIEGRFNDVNQPYQCDVLDAARAILAHLTPNPDAAPGPSRSQTEKAG